MSRPAQDSLWIRLHQQWLAAQPPRTAEPRLAAEAALLVAETGAAMTAMAGAWG